MNKDIAIRRAVFKDAEKITDYNIQMAKEIEDKQLNKTEVFLGVKAVIEDAQKGFYLVAENKDRKIGIVGQLMITVEWSDWRNKWFWWIQSVYIDKKFRNQKVFTNLYQEIIRLVESIDDVCGLRLYVEEYNKSASELYKTLGMIKTSYEIYEMLI